MLNSCALEKPARNFERRLITLRRITAAEQKADRCSQEENAPCKRGNSTSAVPVLVFNVGEYRRDAVKFYADKDFFDPNNTEAVAVRK